MKLTPFMGEGFSCNSYLLTDKSCGVLIDCAVSLPSLESVLKKEGATLQYIILTHGHFDHIETLDEIRSYFSAKVFIHKNDAEMLADGVKNGYSVFFQGDFYAASADRTVSGGDVINAGDIQIKVIHTPGHSKGSVCLECEDFLFTGDTLFANNIGRTDLYGGDGRTIFRSLKMLAEGYPAKTIYPGHGPTSTMEREIQHNYYIRDSLEIE